MGCRKEPEPKTANIVNPYLRRQTVRSTDNAAGQIDSIAELTGTRSFTYDLADRLKTVTASNNQNESYTYDDVGNRLASHRSASYGYQTGQFNRLASTATASYGYDANGNTASKTEGSNFWRYSWDGEHRLVQASTRKEFVRYRYDALGRRVQRTVGAGKDSVKFTYDGDDVLADDNAGTLTKYQNGPGIDNKLRVQTGSDVKYFLADHLGSTNGLADASGAVAAATAYDSFGNPTNANFPTRYQYTGRERDAFSGFYYYRARMYDPNLGRFASQDPIGLLGGSNPYAYVRNMPFALRDSFGLFPNNRIKAKAPENFGQGYRGRVDTISGGKPQPFEIHVYQMYDQDLIEVGIVSGTNGWINKHGIPGARPLGIPDSVVNKINGLNVSELRRHNVLPEKGFGNIRGASYLNGGCTLLDVMGGAVGLVGLAQGLLVDFDTYQRAEESGRSFFDQLEEDNADYPYIITPLGVLPNFGYKPRA